MAWFSPTSKAASSGFQTSAIGSPGGLSQSDLAAALQSNPLLSSISPSMVTGASSPIPQSGPSSFSGMGGSSEGAASRPGEQGINAGLTLASRIPGPQQPYVAGAAAVAPMVEGMFGGGGSPQPMQFPTLQHYQGQAAPPVTVPSVGNAGPLTGGPSGITGLNPQLMRLIQMLQGGGGPSGIA